MYNHLRTANLHFRNIRPVSDECTECTSFIQGDLLEIAFPSIGCNYDHHGTCLMCDYGKGTQITNYDKVIEQFKTIMSRSTGKYNYLLLCTNGSFLDEYNIPSKIQERILILADGSEADEVIIETHVNSISESKLHLLKDLLHNKRITIELGIESIDENVRNYCLCKPLDNMHIANAVSWARNIGIYVNINIILGAPFLDQQEQLIDTIRTIKWSIENDARAIVFPLVIKPFTTLMYMYEKKFYLPISYWLAIKLFDLCRGYNLASIDISWIGPQSVRYENIYAQPVLPTCCPTCQKYIYDFFDDYTKAQTHKKREAFLNQIIKIGQKYGCLTDNIKIDKASINRSINIECLKSCCMELIKELTNDKILQGELNEK